MRLLLDTNVLVRLATVEASQHLAISLFINARPQSDDLVVAPQCLFEFWTVATRPLDVKGLGMSVAEASQAVRTILQAFILLEDPADLVRRWLGLCEQYDVKGRPSYDARLVAFVLGHRIEAIVTLNAQHYLRYSGFEILSP